MCRPNFTGGYDVEENCTKDGNEENREGDQRQGRENTESSEGGHQEKGQAQFRTEGQHEDSDRARVAAPREGRDDRGTHERNRLSSSQRSRVPFRQRREEDGAEGRVREGRRG